MLHHNWCLNQGFQAQDVEMQVFVEKSDLENMRDKPSNNH
jgi:hypothetical protein